MTTASQVVSPAVSAINIAPSVIKIALLGAESTGKSQLANALAAHLSASGQSAQAVGEYLREWCEQAGRTPQRDEQTHIAQTQQERIEAAATQANWIFADTTPLMTAIYSEFIFQDTRLTKAALDYQKSFDLTLLTGLDMPWEADGIQRDGAHVRAPVDAMLRDKLQNSGMAYQVIYGLGEQRFANALLALAKQGIPLLATNSIANYAEDTSGKNVSDFKRWQSQCDKCSDPDCEHRLFRSLQQAISKP